MTWLGSALFLLGGVMFARGVVYTLRPDGPMAQKRKRKNLRHGMPTDMAFFGQRVKRLGVLVLLSGAWLVAWDLSGEVRAEIAQEPAR